MFFGAGLPWTLNFLVALIGGYSYMKISAPEGYTPPTPRLGLVPCRGSDWWLGLVWWPALPSRRWPLLLTSAFDLVVGGGWCVCSIHLSCPFVSIFVLFLSPADKKILINLFIKVKEKKTSSDVLGFLLHFATCPFAVRFMSVSEPEWLRL